MAGVYIPGLKLPESCEDCFFYREFTDDSHCWLLPDCECDFEDRRGDCPLVELPDHGDLVNRDAAPQLVAVLYSDVTGTAVNPTYKIDLSSLPVVIPADKEEV